MAAESRQAVSELGRLGHVGDRRRLGDLEDQPGRVGAGRVQVRLDEAGQGAVGERLAREVDLEAADPRGEHLDRLADDPVVDLADQSRALGLGQELGGRRQRLAVLAHPNQQLVPLDAAAGELDDRLRVEDEAIEGERILDALLRGRLALRWDADGLSRDAHR